MSGCLQNLATALLQACGLFISSSLGTGFFRSTSEHNLLTGIALFMEREKIVESLWVCHVARWANRAYFRIHWDSMKASVLWLHVQVPKLTPAWRRVAMKSLLLLSDVCVQKQGLGPGSMLANDLWAKDYGYLQPGWRMEALPMEELLGTYAQSILIYSALLDSHKFLLALECLIFFFLGDPASSFVIV